MENLLYRNREAKKADIDIEIKSAYENVYEIIGIYQKTFILNLKDLNYR